MAKKNCQLRIFLRVEDSSTHKIVAYKTLVLLDQKLFAVSSTRANVFVMEKFHTKFGRGDRRFKAVFHCSRFAGAGRANMFELLL